VVKNKTGQLTKLFYATVTIALLLVSQYHFNAPQQAEAAPPLVACSAEQIRATERWWYLGNRSVIDFGVSGSAQTLSLNPQNISMLEGSTVVTDTSGELQFYSNGQIIWNKNNQTMPNGSGLLAAPSATQTVASFPSLSRPGVYFVVHNGGAFETGGSGPLRYSEVDMSLDGGLGDVTNGVKNILLDGGANTATEGLIAVPNSDATGFWVITATGANEVGNNNIVAHEFDGDGPTGTIVRTPMSTPNGNTFATFNLSPDRTKLVQHFGNFTSGSGQLRLLNIDAESGVMSEIITWDLPKTGTNGDFNYSADFSPDGRWVYATRIFGGGKLFRYDTQTHTTADALEDNIELVGDLGTNGGQVKRAPDGRMYIANYNATHLHVVNDPNNISDPDFVQGGISLPSGATSQFGLPQTVSGCPAPKNAPVNLSVSASGYNSTELAWSEPVDTGGDTLLGYRIDRSLDGDNWATIVDNTQNTATTYQDSELSPGTTYYYRIYAVYDSLTSGSSNTASATTTNEAPDCNQGYVACFTSAVTGSEVVLEVEDSCEITSRGISEESSNSITDPENYSYPLGLVDFVLECQNSGDTITVTQYYYETQTDNYVLRKYNPNTESYFTINDHTIEDVTVNGSQALRVTFEVTDGGELDVDGEANGEIIDPAGPALQQTSPNSPIDESEEPIISDGLLANTGTRVMIAALLAAGSAGTALFLLKQRDTAS
jgi:hypothetical protein